MTINQDGKIMHNKEKRGRGSRTEEEEKQNSPNANETGNEDVHRKRRIKE